MATHDLRAKIERVKNRIEWLDVVRGIALCGIAFANIGTVWKVSAPRSLSYDFMQLLVQQRFFPIFSLLFGIGFGLMWSKNYGRVPLLRRFLFIGALGALHQFVHPGEALLFYCRGRAIYPSPFHIYAPSLGAGLRRHSDSPCLPIRRATAHSWFVPPR
nr:heparan-alpha-glucosaminide N-acetyltransferase domain-containing protein [Corynebacterium ulcerans]